MIEGSQCTENVEYALDLPFNTPGCQEDCDNGIDDVLTHYQTKDIGIQNEMTELCLSGTTNDGLAVIGCDSISITLGSEKPENSEVKGNKNK